MACSYKTLVMKNVYLKLHEPIIILSVNRVHYNCVLISRNADAYLYILCALILKYQIISLFREQICYFRLLSHRCINIGHIETHTLWNKARVLHICFLVHTPRSSLASFMLCQSYGQLQRQQATCKGSPHKKFCFYY